jgi:UDP-2,3-diacylglucosamine pyrophosphatase LpxH
MKRRKGNGFSLCLENWRAQGVERVLVGIISDTHLDRFFPKYSFFGLLIKLRLFSDKVTESGIFTRGILVVLGDYIDFLTLGQNSPASVSCVLEINDQIARMSKLGIKVIFCKGNHGRWLFTDQAWITWIKHSVPDITLVDYVHITDDWARVLMFHGHIWDIFNCEIEDKQGRLVTPLGDLIVRHLVAEMQEIKDIGGRSVDCSDLHRVSPLHYIPLYLATIDPSQELLRMWLLKFKKLMKSESYRRWVRYALPLGQRILGNILPRFYQIYSNVSGEADLLRIVRSIDQKGSDYMRQRQQELLSGNLEIENRYDDWDPKIPDIRIVITGHSHRAGLEEFWLAGEMKTAISTGSWVKDIAVHLIDEEMPILRPNYFLTWTELECDLHNRFVIATQDCHSATGVL